MKKVIITKILLTSRIFLGKPDNEWIDTVDYMMEQQKDHNNVIKVLHNSDGEVAAIFVQLEKQRQLYKTYGNVIELDGTYKTTKAGFSLYHLLIEDNNGDGQPVAMFLVKEETTDSISTCLEVFSEVEVFGMNSQILIKYIYLTSLNRTTTSPSPKLP